MHKLYIGIDPGKMGGLAFMSGKTVLLAIPMPLSGKEVNYYEIASTMEQFVYEHEPVACIEKVGAMPGQGVTSMFNFGFVTGAIYGLMAGFNIPVFQATPQAWKKVVLAGTKQDKDAAIAFCTRAYPTVNLLATPKSRKPHDGMADAICIARYASIQNL